MTLEQAEKIAEELEANTDEDVGIIEDYSGRGMYGETCVALTVSPEQLIMVGWAAREVGVFPEDVPTRWDSLGKSDLVVY